MVGKNFQIYSVQITGKYIFWSLAPHVEQFPFKFSPQNLSPYKKSFFEKKSPLPLPWKGLPKWDWKQK